MHRLVALLILSSPAFCASRPVSEIVSSQAISSPIPSSSHSSSPHPGMTPLPPASVRLHSACVASTPSEFYYRPGSPGVTTVKVVRTTPFIHSDSKLGLCLSTSAEPACTVVYNRDRDYHKNVTISADATVFVRVGISVGHLDDDGVGIEVMWCAGEDCPADLRICPADCHGSGACNFTTARCSCDLWINSSRVSEDCLSVSDSSESGSGGRRDTHKGAVAVVVVLVLFGVLVMPMVVVVVGMRYCGWNMGCLKGRTVKVRSRIRKTLGGTRRYEKSEESETELAPPAANVAAESGGGIVI